MKSADRIPRAHFQGDRKPTVVHTKLLSKALHQEGKVSVQ